MPNDVIINMVFSEFKADFWQRLVQCKWYKSNHQNFCGCAVLEIYLGLQIPLTTGGIELRASYIQWSYLSHYVIRSIQLSSCIVCKRFAVQTLLRSLEFVILKKFQAWHHQETRIKAKVSQNSVKKFILTIYTKLKMKFWYLALWKML